MIQTAAKVIRNKILEKFNDVDELEFPPTVEELSNDTRKPPDKVYFFLRELLKVDRKCELSDNVSRLVKSYANDFVHGVTR